MPDRVSNHQGIANNRGSSGALRVPKWSGSSLVSHDSLPVCWNRSFTSSGLLPVAISGLFGRYCWLSHADEAWNGPDDGERRRVAVPRA